MKKIRLRKKKSGKYRMQKERNIGARRKDKK